MSVRQTGSFTILSDNFQRPSRIQKHQYKSLKTKALLMVVLVNAHTTSQSLWHNLVIILFDLQFNISTDSKGNPQNICAHIKHPVGGNTTTCSSQYQHNRYHPLVVTVHWMFDPSVVNLCGLNLTVQLTAVRKNMSSPFSIPITVPIGKFYYWNQ